MKKTLIILVALLFCGSLNVTYIHAQANAKAMEHADENAVFNRVGDWFATIGKNDEEKQKILAERKANRAAKRAEKEAKKAKKAVEGKMKDMKGSKKGS